MNRTFFLIGLLAVFSFASVATATNSCTVTSPGWTFATLGQCGSNNTGVSFTSPDTGQVITIFPEFLQDGVVQGSGSGNVNGLFEVQKGQNGNLASGIAPYVNGEGTSPFLGQQGITDTFGAHRYDVMLYVEVKQTGTGGIATGSTLDFLMQQGDQAIDTIDVFKGVFGSGQTAPPDLSAMTQVQNNLSVGAANGGNTVPQFSIVTNTSVANPIEWIAIRDDCTYLLLNQITDPTPGVPEPRFYGLLMAGLLGIGGIWARRHNLASHSV
jgi:hypothetical protein